MKRTHRSKRSKIGSGSQSGAPSILSSPLIRGALAGASSSLLFGQGNLFQDSSIVQAKDKTTTPSHSKITIQIESSTFSQNLSLNCPLNAQTCGKIMDIVSKTLKKYHKEPQFGLTLKLESCD